MVRPVEIPRAYPKALSPAVLHSGGTAPENQESWTPRKKNTTP